MTLPTWTTACPDWERRIVARESLVPFQPLFPEMADKALSVFGRLRLTDVQGQPTMAEAAGPHTLDLVKAIFGSYDPESGRRLVRFFLELIAKKNGKSTDAAGIMLTALLLNWRPSGEFGILAPTKEIADNSFIPARDMRNADQELRDLLHISEHSRVITHRGTGATLKVIAADSETVGGKKFIGLLVDELWLFGKRANARAMLQEAQGGLTSRKEGFVVKLSTQSDTPPTGVFAEDLDMARKIRDGEILDPQTLPILYEYPPSMIKSGTYREPKFFYIPNPNLGRSVDDQYLISEWAKQERAGPAALITFEAKHLNIQVGMAQRSDGWVGAAIWHQGTDRALANIDAILDLSEVATIGADGGGLDDLFGLGLIGRHKTTKHWLGWAHGLISTIGVMRRQANANDYLRFVQEGTLTVFRFGEPTAEEAKAEGAVAELLAAAVPAETGAGALPPDIRYMVDFVAKVRDRGLLAQVGVDAAGIGPVVDALAAIGVTQDAEMLDAVRQGIGLMGAIKTTERKIADRTFFHGGTALMDWCVGNLKVMPTRTAMMVARDDAGFGKIDPMMALFNAAHLMSLNPFAETNSPWEDPTFTIFGTKRKSDVAFSTQPQSS